MGDLADYVDTLTRASEQIAASSDADKRLVDLLNDDSEARAIFEAVNERHPDGYLAELDNDNGGEQ
jgi:hypothetical protein